jgi:putative flippase GtrA
MRDELPEFARFIVAGAINTGISYAVYLVLLVLLPYLAAYTISYVVGIVISYLLLTRFVFRARRRLATAVRFPLVYVAQYLIGSAVIVLLVEAMGVRASIAAIVAIVVSIPVTFSLSRFLLRAKT